MSVCLGISCFYHDSAACVLRDGEVAAAAQEERFNREKGSAVFPRLALNACLQSAGLTISDVDYVAFYEKPFLKLGRVLQDHVRSFPFSFGHFMRTMPQWLSERLVVPVILQKDLAYGGPCLFIRHHLAHAASAFLVSPFEQAAILTVDGVGEHSTTTWGRGSGSAMTIEKEIVYPHSLGLLYSAITTWLGFAANRGEGKVMALGDFGEPAYLEDLRRVVRIGADGSFRVDPSYFGFFRGRTMYSRKFVRRFGAPRQPGSEITQRDKDMAASLQRLLEEALLAAARHVHAQTGLADLCIAGGVGLNCVANDRLLAEGPFERIFVQPAAGDSGAALGAACFASSCILDEGRPKEMRHAHLGPGFSPGRIRRVLASAGANAEKLERAELLTRTASRIAEGKIVCWYQGRMEFGPRALGNRSILADPRAPGMKDLLNARVKHREAFRPYGASVLAEHAGDYFVRARPSPFMLFAYPVREEKRGEIPSAVHVNGTCRLQTVTREEDELYYDLIEEFRRLTGVPMIINTSFNDQDEPIVLDPEDALDCFRRIGADCLVMGDWFVE